VSVNSTRRPRNSRSLLLISLDARAGRTVSAVWVGDQSASMRSGGTFSGGRERCSDLVFQAVAEGSSAAEV